MEIGKKTACLGILALILLSGCSRKAPPPPPQPPEVVVSRPIRHAVTRYVYFTGRTDSVADVELRARVKGFLQKMDFQEGGPVRKGQVLFVIDPTEYLVSVNKAKADWEAAVAQQEKQKFNYERMKDAYKKKVATDLEVADAKANYDFAIASVAQAKAMWESANINLGYCGVVSPVTGKASKRYVDVGNLVGSGEATLLATVVQEDPIYVYFDIDEKSWLVVLQNRQSRRQLEDTTHVAIFQAGVSDGEDFPYQGVLDYASNEVDPNTGTIEVRGLLPNPTQILLPGMFARVRIPYAEVPDAMLIPATAVGYDQTGYYVYVVGDKNIVEHRVIETGQKIENLREVLKGLKDGDRIILEGLLRARPGRPVTCKESKIEPPKIASPTSRPTLEQNLAEMQRLQKMVPTSAPAQMLSKQPTTLPTTHPDLMEGVQPWYKLDGNSSSPSPASQP
jgi:RND family efflux transporter MFP subunit